MSQGALNGVSYLDDGLGELLAQFFIDALNILQCQRLRVKQLSICGTWHYALGIY